MNGCIVHSVEFTNLYHIQNMPNKASISVWINSMALNREKKYLEISSNWQKKNRGNYRKMTYCYLSIWKKCSVTNFGAIQLHTHTKKQPHFHIIQGQKAKETL